MNPQNSKKKEFTYVAGIFANLNKQEFNSARICLGHQHGHRLNVCNTNMATMPSRENALILCLTSLLRAFIKTMQNEKMNNFTLLPEVENMLSLQTTFSDF